jgi:glutamyl-tRNA synthetase
MVRVRFAPSPTGYLHVGGARTALFNWLYARRHGGAFVLRIEDTDAERSSWEMVTGIVEGLRWLGLDWDEGPDVGGPYAPYFQSQRLDRHRAKAEQLVNEGRAYYCFCSTDVLQKKREAAEFSGGGWIYDRACLALGADEIARLKASSAPRAIRFRVPEGVTAFDDLVHGRIEFANGVIEDFVIVRSDGQPTYHLSVVADDIEMRITHVVRGDDHISNTPKHLLLLSAFGANVPAFAHVPLILGQDKKRLSKRHGATSVTEYERRGYLPEAMVNFLALLGWSPGTDQELFSRNGLVEQFTLQGITGSNAVFNLEKLDWMNQQHLLRLPVDEVARRIEPLMKAAGLWRDAFESTERPWLLRVIDLVRSRAKTLTQLIEAAMPFFQDQIAPDPEAAGKHLSSSALKRPFSTLIDAFEQLDAFDPRTLEETLRLTAEREGVKAGALIHATRVAATGRAVSPGLFEVLELLGRDRTVERMRAAARLIPT